MPEIHGRIVVLGARGFVGSHVVERARNAGWDVLALASSELPRLGKTITRIVADSFATPGK